MPQVLKRPIPAFDPSKGLLHAEHFQMAYATNDIDRAADLFATRFGITEFGGLEGETPAGGYIRVKLAWVGTIMYELITCTGPGSNLYVGRLPQGEGFALRHHHLGYLIQDQAQWDGLLETVARNGWAMPHRNRNEGFLEACFVDVPELGHYCEYLFCEPAGVAFFDNVPGN